MSGLKTFLYQIADTLELSPAGLYERQRVLVRQGLLPVREGRGPGSGVPLTPDTLATFLIGLLASDSLTDLAIHTANLCSARPVGSKRSTRKGASFKSDVAKALIGSRITGFQPGDDLHQNLYSGIQVTRHWRGVLLQSREAEVGEAGDVLQGVEYIVSEDARLASSSISHTTSIEMEPFWSLCWRLRRELNPQLQGTK